MNPTVVIRRPTRREPWWKGCYFYPIESGRYVLTYEMLAVERDLMIGLVCQCIREPVHQ